MTLNLWHKHTQPALCPLLAAKLTPVHNGGHARWHCGRSTRSTADCRPKDRFEPSNEPGNVTLSVLEPRDDSAAGAVSAVDAPWRHGHATATAVPVPHRAYTYAYLLRVCSVLARSVRSTIQTRS